MYKLVVFDLDGTLADTSEGIYNAHRATCSALNIELNEHSLDGVIGGALIDIYQKRFGLDEDVARSAVKIYREWYQKYGIHQAEIYPGIEELLVKLQSMGFFLGVATLKREDFAVEMLSDMGIKKYFNCICGMDKRDTLNKEHLICECMRQTRVSAEETVMIGDTESDYIGAIRSKVDFIGVTYGFGFSNSVIDIKTAHNNFDLLQKICRKEEMHNA